MMYSNQPGEKVNAEDDTERKETKKGRMIFT
jgi:hypothetical protein